MSRLITRLFDVYADAVRAVVELEKAGVPRQNISVIARTIDGDQVSLPPETRSFGDHAAEGAGTGAATGGVMGGVGGLLAGLGVLAIPGLGPVVATGWLASAAVGAVVGAVVGGAAGGLVGSLVREGESEENAKVYAEAVRRGGVLVSAKVADNQAGLVETLLDSLNAVSAATRGAAYRERGWTRFDDTAEPYTAAEVRRERSRYLP